MERSTSFNSMKTLKGIFQEPKMHHRRDFLRENKLNLRELQKNTTDKIIQQKQEIERKQLKHLHRYHKSQEHITVTRRSDSQRRYEDNQDRRHNHQPPSRMTTDRGTGAGGLHANPAHFRRSYSQQRGDGSRENILPTQPVKKFDSHEPNKNQIDHKNVGAVPVPRCASATSIQSCDKEIQTEDIIDEDFLYEALKKCSSTEVDFMNRHLAKSNNSLHIQNTNHHDDNKSPAPEHIPYDYQGRDDLIEKHNYQNDQISHTERSQYSLMHNGNGYNEQMLPDHHGQDNNYDDHLQEHFQNLQINPQVRQRERDEEMQSSARSRQTMFSNASKRRSNGNYKLGSRDDIRLPRYLEKEKREKEEEFMRAKAHDPNCPIGHYALSENERLAALNGAQKKMDTLVQELNRMPMTTETLRLRRRKVEIEKELTQIELDIRTFSKPKVYVPAEPSQSY